VPAGYLPSYLHPNFQFHLKSYFKAFIETTKNYVHPRGPVFMVELDYETSFGRLLDPASADYNPDVLANHYGRFLSEHYDSDIKKLNAQYKEKNKDFETVEPPRKFTGLDLKDYPKAIDWFRFREYILRTYLQTIEDLFTSYTVEPLIFRSLYVKPGELLPAYNLVPEEMAPFLGTNVFPEGNYFDLSIKARFLKEEYGFAFATSFVSGRPASDPERESRIAPVDNNERRFYLTAGLAAGFKGMNHYMFVDRDHWYGAPLRNDGTVSEGYEIAKNFNIAMTEIGLEEMNAPTEVAVVGNRLYYWMRETEGDKDFPYIRRLLDDSTVGFCRDMMRLKMNWGVRENRDWSTMDKYKLLFVPSTEVMSEHDQEQIVNLVKDGMVVILCGLMPKYDENFKDCQILANHFRMKTTCDYGISTIEHKYGDFPSYSYGYIRGNDDSKTKSLVKSGKKTVGAVSSRYKGKLYLFTYDIASGGHHHKLMLTESTLEGEGLSPALHCSDPSIDISVQMGEKKGLMFIVAPPAGELSDSYEATRKDIIIRADLKKYGFRSARVKLTRLFEGEETEPIKTTSKELSDGIQLSVNIPDGVILLLEKR